MRLVLLPGLNGSCTLFEPLLSQLNTSTPIKRLELPALGSQAPDDLADLLISQLGDTPFVLLGESFSGPIAYQLALRMPPGLCAVIFVASFISTPNPLLRLLRYAPLPRWLLNQHSLLKLFCLNGQSNTALEDLVSLEIKKLPMHLLRARLNSLAELKSPDLTLQLPALHLIALHDRLVTKKSQSSLKDSCHKLTEIWLPGPHFLLQTQPLRCAEAIEHFMAELPAN